jgi:hypothetical protein
LLTLLSDSYSSVSEPSVVHWGHRSLDPSDHALQSLGSAVHLDLVAQSCELGLKISDDPRADPPVVTREGAVDSEAGDPQCDRRTCHRTVLGDGIHDLALALRRLGPGQQIDARWVITRLPRRWAERESVNGERP